MAGPNILSLFSGVGGLELAVRLALPGSRVVGYVERDAYASAALMARMEESSLDPAPVFVGEIQQLDGRELRGEVDVVCGGIPCQPYSVAGNQLGNEDDRALWHEFARIVGECGPSLVFIENVPTFVTGGGFRPLGEELCRLGFELADPFFVGAGDLGAPHERKRVFILAYRDLDGSEAEWRERKLDEGERAAFGDDTDGCDEEVDRPVGEREVPDAERERVWDEPGWCCWEGWENPSVFEDLGLFPPGPDDWGGWERVFERARFLAPALEPGFRVVANGLPVVLDEGGPDQLRCAGNAVVVAQAYVAFRQLLRWIGRG